MRKFFAMALGASLMLGFTATEPVQLDPKLPEYKPEQRVAGDLRTAGSDTLSNVVSLWAQQFNKFHPGVRMQVEAKGSSTAPPALIENQAQFGAMSRAMKSSEVDAFVKAYGYKPTQLRGAIDCLAVYVNKDCPLDEISLPQIEAVFSVNGPDMRWGDLGVTDAKWRDRPISLYGRNSASGTYGFFKTVGLGGADFKASVKEAPGSAGVIGGVASDPFGMGYSGIGFRTPDVKVLAVSFEDGEPGAEPTQEAANYGEYPLARNLYIYVNYDRNQGLDATRAEFLRLIFSRQGQEAVIKEGFYPVSAKIATEDLAKVGLKPSKAKSESPSHGG
jgi:phosphate transport system substrate-binding protein